MRDYIQNHISELIQWLVSDGVRVLVIVVGTLIALKIARTLSSQLFNLFGKLKGDVEYEKRKETLSSVVRARTKTKPSKQWRTNREFNRRLKKRFDELDIEIPFPHITLYPGQDKQGDSPSLHIKSE